MGASPGEKGGGGGLGDGGGGGRALVPAPSGASGGRGGGTGGGRGGGGPARICCSWRPGAAAAGTPRNRDDHADNPSDGTEKEEARTATERRTATRTHALGLIMGAEQRTTCPSSRHAVAFLPFLKDANAGYVGHAREIRKGDALCARVCCSLADFSCLTAFITCLTHPLIYAKAWQTMTLCGVYFLARQQLACSLTFSSETEKTKQALPLRFC